MNLDDEILGTRHKSKVWGRRAESRASRLALGPLQSKRNVIVIGSCDLALPFCLLTPRRQSPSPNIPASRTPEPNKQASLSDVTLATLLYMLTCHSFASMESFITADCSASVSSPF